MKTKFIAVIMAIVAIFAVLAGCSARVIEIEPTTEVETVVADTDATLEEETSETEKADATTESEVTETEVSE